MIAKIRCLRKAKMPYILGIGHKVSLQDILEDYSFESYEEAEAVLFESGLTIFPYKDEVFIVINNKYVIVNKQKYIDKDLTLTEDEYELLKTYTKKNDKRIKLFWAEEEEEDLDVHNMLEALASKKILSS